MKLRNLEFRVIEDRFPEIVCLFEYGGKKGCYTVVRWNRGSEGYNIEFIGDRPFDDKIDARDVWELMKYGQKVLNASFDLEEYRNENRI